MDKGLLSLISENIPVFSKGQRLIANYILNHYDKASFMTASKLGTIVGVSESTVVRFATELGFDGYPSFQRSLQELVRNRLTTIQRMEVSSDHIGTGDILEKVLSHDIELIKGTIEIISRQTFHDAVKAIANAEKIYIIGSRSASSLANFLAYYLNLIFSDVKLVQATSSSEMFEQIMRISDKDIMIGLSFPRYSSSTVKAFRYASDCNASVLAITDSLASPLASLATHVLLAKSDMASFVDSFVAPLSLLNALIVALGMHKKEDVSRSFETLENIWEQYNVYEKPDNNT
ncbi:MAG TPA: MurR/RpiR family transcriptional regulator [Oscillospiraceae bacterium]|nr:MurR/RpiR family transcriptional regulator [Oscillospiraceae bacterium]